VISASHRIEGGDFARAGAASRSLKEHLKRIGADPEVVRRAMIAAYEAEMNVVIHADRGTLWARLNDGRLDLEVVDDGPGIPDIERAMQPGYSTAGPAARALGFGAGLGLPSIRKHSDRFSIDSRVGRGTRVRSTILLRTGDAIEGPGTSVGTVPERCRGCMDCLKACPTGAVRVRDRRPAILAAQCVGCTECIAACPAGALALRRLPGAGEELPVEDRTEAPSTLVLPLAFLTGFGHAVQPQKVLTACAAAGFRSVRFTEEWEAPLRSETLRLAAGRPAEALPVITPLCPAVINLIATGFASLLPQLAPLLSPVEATCESFGFEAVAVVPACPAQQGLLEADSLPGRLRVLSPEDLRARLRPLLTGAEPPEAPPGLPRSVPGVGQFAAADPGSGTRVLRAEGMRHVKRVLEAAEKGLLEGVGILELTACTGGCFGSPLFPEDPFVARVRHPFLEISRVTAAAPNRRRRRGETGAEPPQAEPEARQPQPPARGFPRTHVIPARRGVRLDPDMRRAIEKLSRIDELTRVLPGRDCGACGCPSCAALAEDVVLGRAAREACVFGGNFESK